MNKNYLVIPLLLLALVSFGQNGKKPSVKEKAPTQKELESMMKEMEQAMNEVDPETKRMMDSLGIKVNMPSMNSIPKMSDKDLAEAWEEDERIVPRKNPAKIAAIPATPSTAALPAYIKRVHTSVVTQFTAADKKQAEDLYQAIRQKPGMHLGNIAVGFWIMEQPTIALYLMGKACQDAPADVDNTNNYASMLTMTGAEHAALPILQNLNRRFPNNSTVLNNIGQAWFGLGETDKANKFLDSTIRIYAYHSQANQTKSLIEESKGDKTAAAESMIRSIKKSHSPDKESRLRKLGKKLSGKDVDLPFRMPQDPLGLERFTWPAYPMDVAQSQVLEKEWKDFREKCSEKIQRLQEQSARLEKVMEDSIQKRMTSLVQAAMTGKPVAALPWYAPVAALKLNYLVEDKDGGAAYRMEQLTLRYKAAFTNQVAAEELKEKAIKAVELKYEPLIGEGRSNPLKAYCNELNEVRSKFLLTVNSEWQSVFKAMIEEERRMLNDLVYYSQYTNWPSDFEVIKVNAKIRWLTIIKDQPVVFQPLGHFCNSTVEEKEKDPEPMKEFDDVACNYKSYFDLGLMDFNNNCSKFEGRLKLGALNYTRKIDSDHDDKLIAASIEVKVRASKSVESGPVKVEGKAEISGKMEWNDKEVTNWEVTSQVKVEGGSNLGHGDKSVDIAGLDARIGMNTGSSVTGKGILKGISITK